MPPPLSKQGW
uniref:Uncharacterized protein n=1 Tax=Anguilla anguilla TaxID=7936 RepID=A0A0E9XQX0_ANGAN